MYLGHIKYRKKVSRYRSTGLFIIESFAGDLPEDSGLPPTFEDSEGDDKVLPWKIK